MKKIITLKPNNITYYILYKYYMTLKFLNYSIRKSTCRLLINIDNSRYCITYIPFNIAGSKNIVL